MNAPNKAIVGAVLVALTTFLVTIKDKTAVDTMTTVDWVVVVVSAIVAGLGVYIVPNDRPLLRR